MGRFIMFSKCNEFYAFFEHPNRLFPHKYLKFIENRKKRQVVKTTRSVYSDWVGLKATPLETLHNSSQNVVIHVNYFNYILPISHMTS